MNRKNNRQTFGSLGSRHRKTTRPLGRIGGALAVIGLLCLLGCLWICKESCYERLSGRMLSLEQQERSLIAENAHLRRELLELSEYTRIEEAARRQLGMIAPATTPDTIWCSTPPQQVMMGSMAFYHFNL